MAATGISTRNPDNSWLTATFTSLRTGLVPENASIPGNAEVPDNAKARAGAMVMMPAKKSTSELTMANSVTLFDVSIRAPLH